MPSAWSKCTFCNTLGIILKGGGGGVGGKHRKNDSPIKKALTAKHSEPGLNDTKGLIW